MNKKIKMSHVYAMATFWGAMPLLMFLTMWFRWYYAFPVVAIGVYSLFSVTRKFFGNKDEEYIVLSSRVCAALVLIAVWMLAIGIGGFFTQEQWDNAYRNAVLDLLVSHPWPVVDDEGASFAYLNYYFAYWLPAAAVGKIFGSYEIAQIALFVYSYLGLALGMLMVMNFCKRRQFLVGMLVFLFCGADIFNFILTRDLFHWHDDLWVGTEIISDPSLVYLCRFIYNQGIPSVVILMLMYIKREDLGIQLFLYSILFSMAPFVVLPITPILGYKMLRNYRESLSVVNAFGMLACMLLSVFFMANAQGSSMTTIFDTHYTLGQILTLILFWYVFCIGIYLPFIWNEVRDDKLFWSLCLLTLICAIPVPDYESLVAVGRTNYDFGWKVPVALTLYLMLKVLWKAASIQWSFRKPASILFALVIILGCASNYNVYRAIFWQNYVYFYLHWEQGVCRPSEFNGKLFVKSPRNLAHDNFVATGESMYTKYFMPR